MPKWLERPTARRFVTEALCDSTLKHKLTVCIYVLTSKEIITEH